MFLQQKGLCKLCGKEHKRRPLNVDHDHTTGEVRGALHRWCNGQLGKVEAAAVRAKRGGTHTDWLTNAITFITTASTGFMYPSHKTDDEKRVAKALAERKRKAAIKVREAMAKAKV